MKEWKHWDTLALLLAITVWSLGWAAFMFLLMVTVSPWWVLGAYVMPGLFIVFLRREALWTLWLWVAGALVFTWIYTNNFQIYVLTSSIVLLYLTLRPPTVTWKTPDQLALEA